MKLHEIEINEHDLAEFCEKNCVSKLLFFGSIVRESFNADSDIDILVDLLPGVAPSLLDFAGLHEQLTLMFGRQVHLQTRPMLPPKYVDYFLRGALYGYAA